MALTPEEEAKFRLMITSYDEGKTVSQMPSVTGLVGSELVEVIQNSTSSKATINNIISLIDSYYVGSQATKTIKNATNSTVAKSDFLGNQIDLTYARKDELSGWSIGDIKLHFGSLAGIGADWHVCDGGTYNGVLTPDMGGSYAVGYKASSPATPTSVTDNSENYGAVGNTCGDNTHTLTIAEMPIHNVKLVANDNSSNHSAPDHQDEFLQYNSNGRAENNDYNIQVGTTIPTLTPSSSVGEDAPHSSRPKSVVLAYIMKIA